MSRRQRSQMKVSIEYTNPIAAPIKKGQKVGELVVEMPGRETVRKQLVAGEAVSEVGGLGRIGAAFEYMLFGSAGAEKPEQ